MTTRFSQWRLRVTIGLALITVLGCNILSGSGSVPDSNPILTPTPTDSIVMISKNSRCKDLSGTLELQVLVGPSDVVGLEPVAIGEIPFSVQDNGDSFTLEGGGALTYHEVLAEEWGTYTVNFDMDTHIIGGCVETEDSDQLNIDLKASGDQMVEVRSEGFQGDYPWSGTHEFELIFPLEEGAQQEGEGWVLVLHLNE